MARFRNYGYRRTFYRTRYRTRTRFVRGRVSKAYKYKLWITGGLMAILGWALMPNWRTSVENWLKKHGVWK